MGLFPNGTGQWVTIRPTLRGWLEFANSWDLLALLARGLAALQVQTIVAGRFTKGKVIWCCVLPFLFLGDSFWTEVGESGHIAYTDKMAVETEIVGERPNVDFVVESILSTC